MSRWREFREQRQSAFGLLRAVGISDLPQDLHRLAQALGIGVRVVDPGPSAEGVGEHLALLRFDAASATVLLSSSESERRHSFALATCIGHLMISPPGIYRLAATHNAEFSHGPAMRFAAELLMPAALVQAQEQLTLRFGLERRRA